MFLQRQAGGKEDLRLQHDGTQLLVGWKKTEVISGAGTACRTSSKSLVWRGISATEPPVEHPTKRALGKSLVRIFSELEPRETVTGTNKGVSK